MKLKNSYFDLNKFFSIIIVIMKRRAYFISALSFLAIFVLYIFLVKKVDVAALGPTKDGITQSIGLSSLNKAYIDSIKESNFVLYKITDLASLLTLPIGVIFLVIGIYELAKRKNIFKVDANILALGVFYVLMFVTYLLFQFVVINYRPVLIDSEFEASFPSSTTMLSITFFVGTIDQINIYVKNKKLKWGLISFCIAFLLFLVIGRIVSGVHWISDIIGAVIISTALIFIYYYLKEIFALINTKLEQKN